MCRRDLGGGVGFDLFELAAHLLHGLFAGRLCGSPLGDPLLGTGLGRARPLIGPRNLGGGVGFDLFELAAHVDLHAPGVRWMPEVRGPQSKLRASSSSPIARLRGRPRRNWSRIR